MASASVPASDGGGSVPSPPESCLPATPPSGAPCTGSSRMRPLRGHSQRGRDPRDERHRPLRAHPQPRQSDGQQPSLPRHPLSGHNPLSPHAPTPGSRACTLHGQCPRSRSRLRLRLGRRHPLRLRSRPSFWLSSRRGWRLPPRVPGRSAMRSRSRRARRVSIRRRSSTTSRRGSGPTAVDPKSPSRWKAARTTRGSSRSVRSRAGHVIATRRFSPGPERCEHLHAALGLANRDGAEGVAHRRTDWDHRGDARSSSRTSRARVGGRGEPPRRPRGRPGRVRTARRIRVERRLTQAFSARFGLLGLAGLGNSLPGDRRGTLRRLPPRPPGPTCARRST